MNLPSGRRLVLNLMANIPPQGQCSDALVHLHIFLLRPLAAALDEALKKSIGEHEMSEHVVSAVVASGLQVSRRRGRIVAAGGLFCVFLARVCSCAMG